MQKAIQDAILAGRYGHPAFRTNNPHAGDMQKRYFADEAKLFNQMNLQYGSNVVNARVQGVDYEDFYAYTALTIRVSAVIDPTTGANLGDDWRRMTVANGNIDFIPRGAKIVFNGNTWLVVNPSNVMSVLGTAIIRRCNATWNHLDYYGNVLSEPFCYGQGGNDLATANINKANMVLMNAYQHSLMQLNPQTAVLRHNTRMILGSQAYMVRGLQNFVQEFSQDEDSVHLQFFDVDSAEPVATDDMQRRVAEGLAFGWEIALNGRAQMAAGTVQTLTAVSVRNGETIPSGINNDILRTAVHADAETGALDWVTVTPYNGTALVLGEDGTLNAADADNASVIAARMWIDSSDRLYAQSEVLEYPVTYLWATSDARVVTVDGNGVVTAVSAGSAVIACSLTQNSAISATFAAAVTELPTGGTLAWKVAPPQAISQYGESAFEAVYAENGVETQTPVAYEFSGASESSYTATTNGNAVTVQCWADDPNPLTVTATCGGLTITANVDLRGW